MNILIVGGPHSGVGKTLACERALRALRGERFGAIKLTVADGEFEPGHDHGASALAVADAAGICGRGASCGVCETVSARMPSRIVTSDGAIRKPGTDTWRLSNAGAVAVVWIIALRSAAQNALSDAIDRLSARGARGILIEGTTALEWLRPAVSVMVATDPGRRWKQVAVRRVAQCDIVLKNLVPSPRGDVAPPAAFFEALPLECDLAADGHPGTIAFERRLRELYAAANAPDARPRAG